MSEMISATQVEFKHGLEDEARWDFSIGDLNEYGKVESICLMRIDSTSYNIVVMHSIPETLSIKKVEFKNITKLIVTTVITGEEDNDDDSAE